MPTVGKSIPSVGIAVCKTAMRIEPYYSTSRSSTTGSYSQRLCATLDAVCFALYCVTHNARGAIFTDLLASNLHRLALRRLSGAGNNPQVLKTVAVAVAIEEASK